MVKPKLCECGCGEPTPIATKTRTLEGIRKGEPRRFIHGHHATGREREVGPDSYCVEDHGYETPCWIWARAKNHTGYGHVRGQLAHRYVYEHHRGPVPEGLTLDHLCEEKLCVNPDHLEAVSHAENCRRQGKNKLTAQRAREVRELAAAGWRAIDIQRAYDIGSSSYYRCLKGVTWTS